jgi:hypothetical protein
LSYFYIIVVNLSFIGVDLSNIVANLQFEIINLSGEAGYLGLIMIDLLLIVECNLANLSS